MLVAILHEANRAQKDSINSAILQARVSFEKDIAYRRWNALNGGLYGKVTPTTQPNPYLNNPERDLTTPGGQRLTLINPAYMTRQVHELENPKKGILGHITSLNPIRPANKPDEWEKEALLSFEEGEDERYSVESLNGKKYLRFMKPLFVTEGCMECHAFQGDKVGDVRGGISAAIPMQPFEETKRSALIYTCILQLFIWLLGVMGLGGAFVAMQRQLQKQEKTEKEKETLQTRLLSAQKLEAVGQLAAGIAHEINTPAQFVGSNLDFMTEAFEDVDSLIGSLEKVQLTLTGEPSEIFSKALEKADWEYLAEELPQALAQSKDGIKRISSIVLAMKDFSHPASKEMAPANLNTLISTTITVARNEWKYVAEIVTELDPELPLVPLLADQFSQVILILLVNAAHAVGERFSDDPGKGRITISTHQVGDHIEMRLTDNGSGMTEEVKKRIFEPFFTTKRVGKGTGQGLAIAYDIVVNKHGGSLECTSTPGEGSSFVLHLPLQDNSGSMERDGKLE